MKAMLAVKGQIVSGPQYANVDSKIRLRSWLDTQVNDLINQADVKMSLRNYLVIRAKISAFWAVLDFLEHDIARREVSKW